MELKCKLIKYLPEKLIGTLRMREFIVEYSKGEYTNNVVFTQYKSHCDGSLQIGTEIVVTFSLKSREWNDKWFTTAVASSVKPVSMQSVPATTTTTSNQTTNNDKKVHYNDAPITPDNADFLSSEPDSNDDLPF